MSKSAITPSFKGRMAVMCPGVRPSIRFASPPTASSWFVRVLIATMDGSLSTIPRPRTYTTVLAVPRSTAMSRPMTGEYHGSFIGFPRGARSRETGLRAMRVAKATTSTRGGPAGLASGPSRSSVDCHRIRCRAGGTRSPDSGEEEVDLALRGLRSVGALDEVLLGLEGQIATDR